MDQRTTTVFAGQLAAYAKAERVQDSVVGLLHERRSQAVDRNSRASFLARAAGSGDTEEAEDDSLPVPVATRGENRPKNDRPRRLDRHQMEVASEAFWEHDADASATIDMAEWTRMVDMRALSVTVDEAFARADADGDGEISLQEWLAAKEASRLRREGADTTDTRGMPTSATEMTVPDDEAQQARGAVEHVRAKCSQVKTGPSFFCPGDPRRITGHPRGKN